MAGSNRTALIVLLLLLGSGTLAAWVLQPPSGALSGPRLQERLLAASAWIHATDCGQGTGFVIDADRRWLLTNYHVVADNTTAEVWFPANWKGQLQSSRTWYLQHREQLLDQGQLLAAKVIRRDKAKDLALLELPRLPEGVTSLTLATTPALPGDRVHTLGCRYDSPSLWTFGQGSVRQLRTLSEGYFSGGKQLAQGARVIQGSTPINEGDSGAALLNDQGAVVGIAAAVAWEHRGDGLFIAGSEIKAFLDLPSSKTQPADEGPRQLYENAVRSVVLIQSSAPEAENTGRSPQLRGRHTGLVLDGQKRLILTTAEACGPRGIVYLGFPRIDKGQLLPEVRQTVESGRMIKGVILARDPQRNLALIEADNLPEQALAVRKADTIPRVGELLHAIGNPDRIEVLWLYSAGCLRQTGRFRIGNDREDPEVQVLLLQMSTSDGDGGSPIFNSAGQLVGMNTGKATPQQQLTFALPLGEIDAFLQEKKGSWDPQELPDRVARARLFLQWRRPERALIDLEQALQLAPASAAASLESSRAQQMQGRLQDALQSINRAIQSEPRLGSAYSHRAAIHLARGDTSAAIADCEQALKLDRDNALAHQVRGQCYQARDQLEAAREELDQAVWLDRKSAAVYLARGQLLARQEKWDAAMADFNQSLTLDPELADAHRSRGDLFWTRADLQSANSDYDQALRLNSSDALALLGKARIAHARQERKTALTTLDRALRMNPQLASAYLFHGQLLLEAHQFDNAWTDLDKALQLQPRFLTDVLSLIQTIGSKLESTEEQAQLYRLSLQRLQPLFQQDPKVSPLMRTALEPQPNEKPSQTAQRLQQVFSTLRDRR